MPKKLKYISLLVIVIIIVIVGLLSQTPTIISATVTPEVIVKGQNQEVTITAVVKSMLWVPSSFNIQAVLAEQGKDYNIFDGQIAALGKLTSQGTRLNGKTIFQGKFTINRDKAETLQVRLLDKAGKALFPEAIKPFLERPINYKPPIPPLRLAVSTRNFALPPDPGEAGKATLEGIDSDHDGLRDDIQREIFFAYPESEKARRALGDSYKAEQDRLLFANDPIKTKEIGYAGYKRLWCLEEIGVAHTQKIARVGYSFTDILLNTDLRLQRGEMAGQNSAGVYSSSEESKLPNCLFDPSSLPD